MLVFVKGSPEAIRTLSSSSTLPALFDATLRNASSTRSGIYQIAIAHKEFDLAGTYIAEVHRDDVEKSLTFAKEGNVLLAMITGKSVLTGICIARESGIIG
ncbi:haloacid dehalogenase-like hydrolase [Fragilaria crotonensis]|nr:haloacid dehalogenase-like hydrolase [Fragilaria crotonensis]